MTVSQLPLFPESKNEEAFREFHAENPHVLDLVIETARKVRAAGAECSIGFVWERLRWILTVETKTGDGFRLNNTHRAYFARLAMHRAPDLAGAFEVRRQECHFDPATVVDSHRRTA